LTSIGDQRNQLSWFIPYFAKIKKTAHFYLFLEIIEGKEPLKISHFISFIQEAKNNIHVIIEA